MAHLRRFAPANRRFFYNRQVIQGLRARGHHVDVVAWPWRAALPAALGSLWGLDWRRVEGKGWDVVVEDGLVMPSLSLRAPRWPFPRVTLMHNPRAFTAHPPWTARWMARLEARYLRRVQGLIGVSRFNVRWSRLHGFRGPATVAYPAGDHMQPDVSPTLLRGRAHEPSPLCVLFIGQIIPTKACTCFCTLYRDFPPTPGTSPSSGTPTHPHDMSSASSNFWPVTA